MKILFICAGNVARSQMAEAIFNNLSKGKDIAISAGTKVVREGSNKEGQKIKDKDMNIVNVMQEIGIDVSDYERKQITPEMFKEADKVIVINPSKNLPQYLHPSEKVIFWDIDDPYNQDLEFARKVRDQIHAMISNLISEVA